MRSPVRWSMGGLGAIALAGREHRVLHALLGANLASAAAAALVNIFVAAWVRQRTGAALWAAVAIVVAYLPPLFIGAHLGGLIDRHLKRRHLLLAESGSLLLSLACALAVHMDWPLALLLVLLAARALLVTVVRNSLTRWLKLDAPPALQEGRMQLFILAILLGLPASGLSMALAAAGPLALGVGGFALLFHVGALLALLRLPGEAPKPEVTQPAGASRDAGWSTTTGLLGSLREIWRNPALVTLLSLRLFAQPVFQGAEQVLVSVNGAALGTSDMARMQTVGGCGLMLGFVLVRLGGARLMRGRGPGLVIGAGLASLFLAATAEFATLRLSAFLGMTLCYELLYVHAVSAFFRAAPTEAVARYSITSTHLGGSLMSAAALLFGVLIDALGLFHGTCLYLGFSLAYGALLLALSAARRPC